MGTMDFFSPLMRISESIGDGIDKARDRDNERDAARMAAGLLPGGGGADLPASGSRAASLDTSARPVSGSAGSVAPSTGDDSLFPSSLIGNESGGRWNAQNGHKGAGGLAGHFGRLQFGRARLNDAIAAGALPQGTTPEAFMASPDLQMAAEKWHFGDIDKRIVGAGYDKLIGTDVGGIPVTLNGMRAAAHLGGFGGLSKFIASGGRWNPSDANKTSLAMYMRRHGSAGGVLAGSTPLPGSDAEDDLSIAGNGPGAVLSYKGVAPTPAIAPSPSDASTAVAGVPQLNDWSQQMIADGLKTGPDKPISMFVGAKEWDDNRPFFTNADGTPLTVRQVAEKLKGGGAPAQAAPAQAAAGPDADMPAEGASAAQFMVPQPGRDPLVVPAPAAPAARAQTAMPATANDTNVERVRQMLLSSNPAARKLGMALAKKYMGRTSASEPFEFQGGWFQRDSDGKLHQVIAPSKDEGPYTLTPGQTRFGKDNKPVASVPDREKGTEQEAKLRGEFTKQIGTLNEVHDAFGRVIAATEQREANPNSVSPASDIALIFGYMKMLDPGSVVREGEFATAQNAGSIPERVLNTYNKALRGEFLTEDQRQDFVNQAGRLYDQTFKRGDQVAERYRGLSRSYGLDEGRVVALPQRLTPPRVGKDKTREAPVGSDQEQPPVPGAVQGPDKRWYLKDPARPGKYLQVQ